MNGKILAKHKRSLYFYIRMIILIANSLLSSGLCYAKDLGLFHVTCHDKQAGFCLCKATNFIALDKQKDLSIATSFEKRTDCLNCCKRCIILLSVCAVKLPHRLSLWFIYKLKSNLTFEQLFLFISVFDCRSR